MSITIWKTVGKGFSSNVADAVGAVSLLFLCIASGYVSGWGSAYVTAVLIALYAFLFYVVRVFYCRVTSKDFPKLVPFLRAYVRRMGILALSVVLSIGAFSVYENEIDPAKLPEYVITNGEKTVRFRTMSHIASESFYKGVSADLSEARKQGYVLFYEGVRPGSPENAKKFDALMGFKFDKNLYAAMSKLYGLVPQDTASIVGTFQPKDRNVDVSVDEIVANYEKRRGAVSGEPLPVTASGADAFASDFSKEISLYADELTARELGVVRYLNRAIMSLVIKNRDASNAAFAGLGKEDLFSAILQDRDKVVVDALVSTEEKKIFVTYGLLHFDGVFDLLQDRDPRWRIVEPITYRYPTLP